MIQSLDVISVNIYHILISLLNLTLLFLVVKKFLFKPVKKMMAERQKVIDDKLKEAENARQDADSNKKLWEEKLRDANKEAKQIVEKASSNAKAIAEKIVEEADVKAGEITKRAEEEIALERKKASQKIKSEIVDVSYALTEKMLERELNKEDHQNMINDFIDKMEE